MPTSQPANDPVDTSLGTIEGQPVMTVDWGKNRKLHIPLSNVLWLKTEAAE